VVVVVVVVVIVIVIVIVCIYFNPISSFIPSFIRFSSISSIVIPIIPTIPIIIMGWSELSTTFLSNVAPWVAVFQTMYWVLHIWIVPRYWSKESREWKRGDVTFFAASMVSALHSTVVTILAAHCLVHDKFLSTHYSTSSNTTTTTTTTTTTEEEENDDAAAATSFLFYTTPYSHATTGMFVGYITSDLILLLFHFNEWPGAIPFLIHHVIAIWSYMDMMAHGFCHFLALLIVLFEGTGPFINLRWYLSQTKRQDTTLYLYNGYLLTIGWLILRIGVGGYVGYLLWGLKSTMPSVLPWYSCYGSVGFTYCVGYALQWFWFYKILKGAMKILMGSKKMNKNYENQPPQPTREKVS
jgi:TLC domain